MTLVAQGGTYSWTAAVRDGQGALADSADLTLTIADLLGAPLAGFPVSAPAIIRDSLGTYHYVWAVAADQALGVYDADWAGTVDGLAIGGSDSVEVVLAGSIIPDPTPPYVSYATVNDVQAELSRVETDQRALSRISSALTATTDRLIHELGFDFFKHPDVGTETRLFDGRGHALLHVHSGLVSVSLIRIRVGRTSDWVSLAATDYDLEAQAAANPNQTTAVTEPFDHIRLNGTGSYSRFPKGKRLIEITGVFGWPAIPRIAIEANVDWARQTIAADRTYPGGVISPDEDGRMILPPRAPDIIMRLRQWALYRFACDT
jgi:hypothetical protein